ncbi:glycosyltransferase family 4 protein [Betaproteobacteria bacterium PRO7]|nr:glycosyltransferase family 4 protein [Betaproteobacteria bacterium PRO7]
MRVLTFSSLFPSEARPRHGIFVETRLRHLIADCNVEARVIAPVPWFPLRSRWFGRYAVFAATPSEGTRIGGRVKVAYPRYPMLPRIGVAFQPRCMASSALTVVEAWFKGGWTPDVIDAHYFYPDGVAASMLAERLGRPYLITARGTDVNVLARMPGPARKVLRAARGAVAIIAVSEALRCALIELGVEPSKVFTLRNGVDLDVFRIEDRMAARGRLGLPEVPLLASVGNLVEEKDQALAIRSLCELPEHHLLIVGDGPLRWKLEALSRELGVSRRVRFLAPMPQRELSYLYSSVDALLLTSTREGWPNVVLESLACGTPVVALDVGAVREILGESAVGRVVELRDPSALAAAVRSLTTARPPREEVRGYAARFGWKDVSIGQWRLLQLAMARYRLEH